MAPRDNVAVADLLLMTPAAFPGRREIVLLFLALMLAACSQPPAPAEVATGTSPDAGNAAAEAAADARQEAALAALGAAELRNRGRDALREQRIYAPAGDNAMEYYLALRKAAGDRPDVSAESALMDLQPYAVIAAEQALARGELDEADRLRRLIAAADPGAPSLPRLTQAIAQGRASKESAAATVVATQGETAAPPVARSPAPDATVTAGPAIAPAPAPTPLTESHALPPPPAAIAPAPTVVAADAPLAAPTPARSVAPLVAIRTPEPPYPQEERRLGTVGEVQARFTVNADGSIGDLEVESIGTRRLSLERSVKSTLGRWKFEPVATPQSVTRRFSFRP